jgi:hypothetical protein
MSSAENVIHSLSLPEERLEGMSSLAEIASMDGSDEIVEQHTEALKPLLEERHTDPMPRLPRRKAHKKSHTEQQELPRFWREVIALREANRHLSHSQRRQHEEWQRLEQEYQFYKATTEKELQVIHNGHQQELAQLGQHLQNVMEERNRFQEASVDAEQRLQALQQTYEEVATSTVQRQLAEALHWLDGEPEDVPPELQEIARALDARSRNIGKQALLQSLCLKHEIQTRAEEFQAKCQQLDMERQQLFALQYSLREQAEARQRTLQAQLRERSRIATISTSLALIALLVVLQYSFLSFFHVAILPQLTLSLLAPIVLCALLAFFFRQPFMALKYLYVTVLPQKKKAAGEA